VILWRVLPWRAQSRPREPGGALWFPRELQGAGRHDNPDLYGCLYVGEQAISPIAEALAPFRGTGSLTPSMLIRGGAPLTLVEISLSDDGQVLDLDDPSVLAGTGLRPSRVATGRRDLTQAYAARLHALNPPVAALRWWSTIEASLINLTVFDRAQQALEMIDARALDVDHVAVRDAAELLGLIP
jgi:hypothetical protein